MDSTIYISEKMLYLVPFLYIIGLYIKLATNKIPNKLIPFILLVISLVICFVKLGISYHSIVQSVLIAGNAVFAQEILNKFIDFDNIFNTKKEG